MNFITVNWTADPVDDTVLDYNIVYYLGYGLKLMEGLLNSIISGKIQSSFQQTLRISKGCHMNKNKNAGKDVKSCELVQPFKKLQKVMKFKQMLRAKNIKSIKKLYEHQINTKYMKEKFIKQQRQIQNLMEKGKLYIIKTFEFTRKGIFNEECSHLIKDFYFQYILSRTQKLRDL